MSGFYDEIEIEDLVFDVQLEIFKYPCPCGDQFEIGLADMLEGDDIAACPSCSLLVRIIFEEKALAPFTAKVQAKHSGSEAQLDEKIRISN